MKCPICGSKELIQRKIKSYKIQSSYLYKDIIIVSCWSCNHHFNKLTRREKNNLKYYYWKEYYENIYTPTEREGISFKLLGLINNKNFNITTNKIDFLEHCWNLEQAIHNIKQLDNFTLLIPDASRYDDDYYFEIKEHIHHFNINNIIKLFNDYNLNVKKAVQKILNGKLYIPTLEIKMEKIKSDQIYYYGISREFLNAWDGEADGLFDETPNKIGKKINGIIIQSPESISMLPKTVIIKIGSRFWYNEIEKKIRDKGFKGICLRMFS